MKGERSGSETISYRSSRRAWGYDAGRGGIGAVIGTLVVLGVVLALAVFATS